MSEGLHVNHNQAPNDYFAAGLLARLNRDNPYQAAFVAQDVSRQVGFDFNNIQDVLGRALDEVRETREAHEDWQRTGKVADKEHLGDEIADLVFSTVNIVRHRGMPASAMPGLAPRKSGQTTTLDDALVRVTDGMNKAAKGPRGSVEREAKDILEVCDALAGSFGFDLATLTRENVRKYLTRCDAIEKLAQRDGKTWADLARKGEIIKYWKQAKALL